MGIAYHEYSNRTEFAIKSDAERYAWIVFHVFVLLSSLIGDSLILIASIKYRAFKINKLILVMIKHIAVSDLSVALFSVLPRTVALISNGQIYGTMVCKISIYIVYYFTAVGVFQMCAMTTCKVATLQYPLRTNSLSSRDAHKGCIAIWLLVLSFPALLLFDINSNAVFDWRVYFCDLPFEAAMWLKPFMSTVYSGIPNVLVTASTIRLLFLAKQAATRRNKNVNMQGVVTIVLVAVIYHVSLLPFAIYRAAESSVADKRGFFHNEFYRISVTFHYFNVISNFFVYSLTIESFRQFLCRLVHRPPGTLPAN